MEKSILKEDLFRFYNTNENYYSLIESLTEEDFEEINKIKRFFHSDRKIKILDVACGSGRYASSFTQGYFGVDISLIGLKNALKNFGDSVRLVSADVAKLPYKGGSFDVVISAYALEHFIETKKTLDEMFRVCKTGGRMIIVSPAWERPSCIPPSLAKEFEANGFKKLLFIAGRFLIYLYMMIDRKKIYFNTVKKVKALEKDYAPDSDTVYIVNIREIVNYFRSLPCKIIYLQRVVRIMKRPLLKYACYNLKTLIKSNPYRKYFGTRLFIVVEKSLDKTAKGLNKEEFLTEEFKKEWADQIDTAWNKLDKNKFKKESRDILNKEGQIVYKYVMQDASFRLHQSFSMTRNAVSRALDIIKPENKVVLDIGCGPYPDRIFKLSSNNNKVICADLSKGYLDTAHKIGLVEGYNNVYFVNTDVEEICLKDNSVDIIIFSEVIEHLLSYDIALEQLRRILKKDGVIILTTPNRLSFIRLLQIFKNRLRHITKPGRDYFLTNSHMTEFSFIQFSKLIKDKFIIKKIIPVKYDRESSKLIHLINLFTKLPFLNRYSYSICVILSRKS